MRYRNSERIRITLFQTSSRPLYSAKQPAAEKPLFLKVPLISAARQEVCLTLNGL
jgi:hypothetical protein